MLRIWRRKADWPAVLCAVAALSMIGGCGQPGEREERSGTAATSNANGAAQQDAAAQPGGAAAVEERAAVERQEEKAVELEPIDKAGFEKMLAEADAKVVLVDYWGSWCINCMQQFPHTVDLHRKYADKGLKVVSLAVEFDTETGPGAAHAFLKKRQATFANYIVDSEYDEAREAFDVGQFPTYRLFAKGGKLIANFEKGEDHEEIEAAIRQALDDRAANGEPQAGDGR